MRAGAAVFRGYKKEWVCRPAGNGIGNRAAHVAALCKLLCGKLRWRVSHESKPVAVGCRRQGAQPR